MQGWPLDGASTWPGRFWQRPLVLALSNRMLRLTFRVLLGSLTSFRLRSGVSASSAASLRVFQDRAAWS